MKNILLIITLCITTSSIAMELIEAKKEKPNILAEITCIQKPFKALYLTENIVLINGRKQCSVVNIATNQEIKRIFDNHYWSSCIAVHPNKTKFALAAYHHLSDDKLQRHDFQQMITIYDAQTYNIEHIIDCDHLCSITSMLFSPLDDTIAACGEIKIPLFNYKTNTVTIIDVPEARQESQGGTDNNNPIISFHPTQPLMTLAWKNIYFHNLETSTRTKKSNPSFYHDFCEYSPDGSFLAKGISWSDIDIQFNQNSHPKAIRNHLNNFTSVIIHPNSKTLITISRLDDAPLTPYNLKYWNVIDGLDPITTMDLPVSPIDTPDWRLSPSFSPNGTKLIIVLNEKCIELEVPFEVIYQNITKEKFLYLLFLINNINPQIDRDAFLCCLFLINYIKPVDYELRQYEIPQDVTRLIARTLLTICKR